MTEKRLSKQRIYSPDGDLLRKITSSHVYDYKYKLHDFNIVSKETYIDGIFTDAKSFSSDGILLKQMKYINGNIETIKFLQDEGLKV